MGVSDLTPEQRAEHFKNLLRDKKEQAPAPQAQESPSSQFDSDLVPDIEDTFKLTKEQIQLEDFIQEIDIIEAYRTFIGKMEPKHTGRPEGVMISCPVPGHADNNPSAWINTDKKVWHCGACQLGGDLYDLAAIGLGFPWPQNYKTKDTFPLLKKQIAERFGMMVHTSPLTGQTTVMEPAPESDEEPEPEPVTEKPKLSVVTELPGAQSVEEYEISHIDSEIKWQEIIPEGTFIDTWINTLGTDHIPHEFHFWTGMLALGFASGWNNLLLDSPMVKGNLNVCLYGGTGLGKTRAARPLEHLIREVMPFEEDQYDDPAGVKIIPSPGSGEALVDAFNYPVQDMSTQAVIRKGNVTGLLRQDEFAELMKKAERTGASLKEKLMALYDATATDRLSSQTRTSGIVETGSPYCSILSTTQPGAIKSYLNRTDVHSGLLNRFIFAAGNPRNEMKPFSSGPPDLTAAIGTFRDVVIWALPGHIIDVMGSPGGPAYEHFFRTKIEPMKLSNAAGLEMMQRTDLTLKKLILLFCMNEKTDVVTEDMIHRVVALYPYLQSTYSMFSADIIKDDISELEDDILEFFRDYEEKQSRLARIRDYQRSRAKRGYSREDIGRAINTLVKLGMVEEVPVVNKKGPNSTEYRAISD